MCKILQILLQVMLSLADSSLTPPIQREDVLPFELSLNIFLRGEIKSFGKKIFPQSVKDAKKSGLCRIC